MDPRSSIWVNCIGNGTEQGGRQTYRKILRPTQDRTLMLHVPKWVESKYVDKRDLIEISNIWIICYDQVAQNQPINQPNLFGNPNRCKIPTLHPQVRSPLQLKASKKLTDLHPPIGQSSKVGKQSCQENSRHKNTCWSRAFQRHFQIVATPSPNKLSRFTMIYIQSEAPWIAKLVYKPNN